MIDINYIMSLLDWNNSLEEQKRGIELAQKVKDFNVFIQPCNISFNINVWDNCAKILFEKSDEELEPYLNKLLEWLQDLNWPGALTIALRLKLFSGRKLKLPLENAIKEANSMLNFDGSKWLYGMSGLIENDELRTCLSNENLSLLKKFYNGID